VPVESQVVSVQFSDPRVLVIDGVNNVTVPCEGVGKVMVPREFALPTAGAFQ
jgi:hypothetical protein